MLLLNLDVQGLTLEQSDIERWDLVSFTESFSTPDTISPQMALAQFTTGALISGNTAFGFSENFFWIKVPVCNELGRNESFYLEVDNPHIDYIQAWAVSNSQLVDLGISGDRIPFHDRTIDNRGNVFKLSLAEGACTQLLLMVDKRYAAVTVPIVLSTETAFQERETRQTLIYGFYFGMLLLILLYSLLIYVIQRKSTYLWYAIYVLFLALYLFVYVGYGFQVIYPWSATVNNTARMTLIILVMISHIRFSQFFLQLSVYLPKINKVYNVVSVLCMLIICWGFIVAEPFPVYRIWGINMVYSIISITIILLVVALIKTYKVQRSSVIFYIGAFSMNIFAFVLVVLEEYGLIELNNWPLSPMFIGLFFEIIIFSIGLSYRSRLISDDRERLLGSILTLNRKAVNAYIEGVEGEKKRVASELHDDISSRLALLKRSVESSEQNQHLVDTLADMSERVRKISYNLNPVALDEDSFLEQLRKLVAEHRLNGLNVVLQAFSLSKTLPKTTGLELYRIVQEALENIQKYASAKRVDVQLFQHDGELLLAIEDNGKGFDQDAVKTGMGTRNMRTRAKRMGGTFDISSAPSKGTSIMVTVPFEEN
ncbi:7TM diverse intracellular signaling domain-containing protein [Bacteroidota bacterium]